MSTTKVWSEKKNLEIKKQTHARFRFTVPQFVKYNSTIFVPEDAKIGRVIGELEARDRDQGVFGNVRFQLNNNRDKFRVETINQNRGTGRIVLIGRLDHETEPVYQLSISAVDGPSIGAAALGVGGLRRNTASLSIVVQVQDVQDSPPQFVRFKSVVR